MPAAVRSSEIAPAWAAESDAFWSSPRTLYSLPMSITSAAKPISTTMTTATTTSTAPRSLRLLRRRTAVLLEDHHRRARVVARLGTAVAECLAIALMDRGRLLGVESLRGAVARRLGLAIEERVIRHAEVTARVSAAPAPGGDGDDDDGDTRIPHVTPSLRGSRAAACPVVRRSVRGCRARPRGPALRAPRPRTP